MFGVTTRARGSSSADQHLHAVVVEQARRRSTTRSPDRRRRAAARALRSPPPPLRRSRRSPACRSSTACSVDVAGDRFDLRGDQIGGERRHAAATPVVFCAVMAVIALVPYTPSAANVFRSAWMPAPPLESLPGNCQRGTHTLKSASCSRRSCATVVDRRPPRALRTGRARRRRRVHDRADAIAAQISIPLPFTPVPFTLQPMVVLARRPPRSDRGSA